MIFPWLLRLVVLLSVGGCATAPMASKKPFAQPRVVEAEGVAPIINGDRLAAQKASLAEAQRSAVEKALGVRISGETLVDKSVAINSHISARTDGIVTKYEIISAQPRREFYATTIRAWVSVVDPELEHRESVKKEILKLIEKGRSVKSQGALRAPLDIFFEAAALAVRENEWTLHALAADEIESIFSGIRGSVTPEHVVFTPEGESLQALELQIFSADGKLMPGDISLPVEARFVESRGRFPPSLQTSAQGRLQMGSIHIDPYKDRAVMRFRLGWDFSASSISCPSHLQWNVTFQKQTKVLISVVLMEGASRQRQPDFSENIRMLFRDGPYMAQTLDFPVQDRSREEDMKTEADLFLSIVHVVSTQKHPQLHLHRAQSKCTLRLEKLRLQEDEAPRRVVFEDTISGVPVQANTRKEAISIALDHLQLESIALLKRKLLFDGRHR